MAAIHNALMGSSGNTFTFAQTLSTDTTNYNLRTAATAAGWDGVRPLTASITVSSGIVVSANSTGVYAFDTGTTSYPTGSSLSVSTVSAFVIGMGGAGTTVGGGVGGPAVRVNLPTVWDNASGVIGGGGGGGGGGETRQADAGTPKIPNIITGAGGSGGGGRTGRTNSSPNGTFSSAGGGFAGSTQTAGSFTVTGGIGGAGGSWGAVGFTGGGGSGGSATAGPYAGGAAGAAIAGNSNITWTNTGTRLGAIT